MEQYIVDIKITMDDSLLINFIQWVCKLFDYFLGFFLADDLSMQCPSFHKRVKWPSICIVLDDNSLVGICIDELYEPHTCWTVCSA